jgi:CubicO group peptidase (beta-lactamase class C family)
MLNPRSATFKAFTNPKALTKLPDINTRRLLEAELPSVNGTGTARAIATVYGNLASGVGGVLGLTAATVAELERPVTPGFDEIFGLESAFALGFMKPFPILSFGSTAAAYGHTGSGGSFGFADPATGTGYAYVMNRNGYGLPTDPREVALRNALQATW